MLMYTRKFSFIMIFVFAITLTLAGCGGGGGGGESADQTAIRTAFNAIGFDGSLFFGTGMYPASLATLTTTGGSSFGWTNASFTLTGCTCDLTGITMDTETTAHATANIAVTATYSISGSAYSPSSPDSWNKSGSITLSGTGTVTFVKKSGTWSVDQIPTPIYCSNSTSAPTIESLNVPVYAYNGLSASISGTVTSHDASRRLGGFLVMKGFDKTSTLYKAVVSSASQAWSQSFTTPTSLGNVYGGIIVVELASDGTYSSSNYWLNIGAYLGVIRIDLT